jgi:hypothetical protein
MPFNCGTGLPAFFHVGWAITPFADCVGFYSASFFSCFAGNVFFPIYGSFSFYVDEPFVGFACGVEVYALFPVGFYFPVPFSYFY